MRNEEFTFNCANSEDIKDVVQFFLDGLKKRSKYVVATEKYKPSGTNSTLSTLLDNEVYIGGAFTLLEKGDLARLNVDHSGETLMKTRWCVGTNERSKKEGDFPLDSLYILPTLSKPPADIYRLVVQDTK